MGGAEIRREGDKMAAKGGTKWLPAVWDSLRPEGAAKERRWPWRVFNGARMFVWAA